MITGVPTIDIGLQDIEESLKKSLKKREEFKRNLTIKLKKANISKKELIIFKLFFNGLNSENKKIVMELILKNPFSYERLWKIIGVADYAKQCSADAYYNRNKCCIEIMSIYKLLLYKMSKLAEELNISNSLELSVLFSYLLWNGYLSKTKKHEYKEYEGPLLMGLHFTDISNGIGVCRNYSEMLKDFLEFNGYGSVILENYLDDKIKVDYKLNIDRRKIYSNSSGETHKKKKANHVFNLIEDNGLYIYDSTNLLLYELKNKNTADLINGKARNIIYPYHSYDFCYSKEDEKMLDRLFSEINFASPYNKTDFISTCEVNLEVLRNNTSLLDDFYIEARPDILGISKETRKMLTKIKY